ncbi:T9SS type A sorting domain-containing protein [bacterium]|nr:T9SS type A sorting domain-containing protein [bacterium]
MYNRIVCAIITLLFSAGLAQATEYYMDVSYPGHTDEAVILIPHPIFPPDSIVIHHPSLLSAYNHLYTKPHERIEQIFPEELPGAEKKSIGEKVNHFVTAYNDSLEVFMMYQDEVFEHVNVSLDEIYRPDQHAYMYDLNVEYTLGDCEFGDQYHIVVGVKVPAVNQVLQTYDLKVMVADEAGYESFNGKMNPPPTRINCCYQCTSNDSMAYVNEMNYYDGDVVRVDASGGNCNSIRIAVANHLGCGNVVGFAEVARVDQDGTIVPRDPVVNNQNYTQVQVFNLAENGVFAFHLGGAHYGRTSVFVICSNCEAGDYGWGLQWDRQQYLVKQDEELEPVWDEHIPFDNDVPSFLMGHYNNSSLEFDISCEGVSSWTTVFDTAYATQEFPERIATDGSGPSVITIQMPTKDPWLTSVCEGGFHVIPVAVSSSTGQATIRVTCPEATQLPGPFDITIDATDPIGPHGIMLGQIFPVNNAFSITMELIEGDYVIFDQVALLSDEPPAPGDSRLVKPDWVHVSSPRMVGHEVSFTTMINAFASADVEDAIIDLSVEDEAGTLVYGPVSVTVDSDYPAFDVSKVYNVISPDQTWIPETPGTYAVNLLGHVTSIENCTETSKLTSSYFEVYSDGYCVFSSENLNDSRFNSPLYTDSQTFGRVVVSKDDFFLRTIETKWTRAGDATLSIHNWSNGVPGAMIGDPIQLDVDESDLYPGSKVISMPSDSDFADLSTFFVKVTTPSENGAILAVRPHGSTTWNHYYSHGQRINEEVYGEWWLVPSGVQGGTAVSGSVSGKWTVNDSPYILVGDVEVESGQVLEIDPAVTVLSMGNYQFQVNGALQANGTSENPVRLETAPGANEWYGLMFSASSSQNKLNNCVIKNAEFGVIGIKADFKSIQGLRISGCDTGLSFESMTVGISQSEIFNCVTGVYSYYSDLMLKDLYVHDCVMNGVLLDNLQSGTIMNTRIERNGQKPGAESAGLLLYRSSPLIDGCVIKYNGGNGIELMNKSNPILAFDPPTGNGTNIIAMNGTGVQQETEMDAELAVYGESLPFMKGGHNDIWDEADSYLIYRSSLPGEPVLDVKENYFDSKLDKGPDEWFVGDINFLPYDTSPNNPPSTATATSEDELLLISALQMERDSLFSACYPEYLQIVEDYADSASAAIAITRMIAVAHSLGDGLDEVIADLGDIEDTTPSDLLAWKAQDLRLRVQAYDELFVPALTHYADIIENPISSVDSIFAVIDSHRVAMDSELILGKRGVQNWGNVGKEISSNRAIYIDSTATYLSRARGEWEERKPRERLALPDRFELGTLYPNPFNPQITIQYALPEQTNLRIEIYNVLGQRVRELVNSPMKAGFHRLQWDGRNDHRTQVASGIYFVKMSAQKYVKTKKIVMLK